MQRSVAALLLAAALTGGCGAAPPSSSPSRVDSGASRFFAIDEVGLGPDGYITLLNYTDVAASLDELYLCQPPTCVDLPDVVVEPGEVARIAVGDGAGLDDVAMTDAPLALEPADGEIAIYESEDVSDPTKIHAYLEWGSTPHEATRVAIEAGLWRDGSYAPSSPDATRLYQTDANLWVFDTD
jgi:hypothetical protein